MSGESETTAATSDLTAKRAAIQTALDAQAKSVERRVYVLPRELVGRVLDYQLENLLPSEVSAVRELLERGLEVKGFANGR